MSRYDTGLSRLSECAYKRVGIMEHPDLYSETRPCNARFHRLSSPITFGGDRNGNDSRLTRG
jgi:hypothetical protein